MKPVVTFGEVMLRLSPPGHLRLLQVTSLDVTFGGAEANVAVGLSLLGQPARFVTALPDNDIGQLCINQLRGVGVDTTQIVRSGKRVGTYYVEKGASQRGSTVLYDREHSAIAEIDPGALDWDKLLAGAAWFHFTGITPALSVNCQKACQQALEAAKRLGIPTSCDLNYRKKLWSRTEAGRVLGELLPSVQYCIANEEDADDVFGIRAGATDVTSGALDHSRYESVAAQLTQRFGFKGVAITLRESHSASENGWSGMLYTEGKAHFSRKYEITVIDRVGGGDSFGAGLIYALVQGSSPERAIEFAVANSCLKHTIVGDYNYVKRDEVEKLMAGDGSGRVQR
ncbi:MAG: sugar kinase [Polyangiaceae bacterium]|nr:sugar kinase [Polyangiaceae bacterium]